MAMKLINDLATLKTCLGGVQKVVNWPTWEGFVNQAELMYIRPVIGAELYAELAGANNPSAKQAELIQYLRYASAYYAYQVGFPQLITSMGDAGISVSNPAQAQPMGKWLYVDMKKQLIAKADGWFEIALEYLDNNVADFDTWNSSTAYQTANRLFIRTAKQLTRHFPDARGSRRLFIAMMDYLDESEKLVIEPIISPEYFADLKNRLKNPESIFSGTELQGLTFIRYALVNHAFSQAIPALNLNEDFRLVQETDGVVNEDYLSAERRSELQRTYTERFEYYAARLKKFLDDNAETLTVYRDSATYSSTLPKRYERQPNDPSKPYFRL